MKVLIACGGTGGHIFPGVALAEELEDRFSDAQIVFVGTERGLEREIIGKTKWRLILMKAPSMVDKKGLQKVKALFALMGGLREAHGLIKRERPGLVMGVGGYASVPVMLAASLMRKPTVVIEPNACPGLANKMLKYFVSRIVVAFDGMEKYFNPKKLLKLGVPVRKNIFKTFIEANPVAKKVILVIGGSQGAETLNRAVLESLPLLGEQKEKLHFVHQVGKKNSVDAVAAEYEAQGCSAEVFPFIEEMGPAYARADFVISRAGANSVAELTALHKPALLVPYPFAAGDHQTMNAKAMEQAGGAKILADSAADGKTIAAVLKAVFITPGMLEMMRGNLSRKEGRKTAGCIVDAALELVNHV